MLGTSRDPGGEPSTQEQSRESIARKTRIPVLLAAGSFDGQTAGQRWVRLGNELIIRRGPEGMGPAAWSIDDDTISRQHAVIACEGSAFYLRDLGSRNGTWVGRHLVRDGQVPLRSGAAVLLGSELAVFRRVTEDQLDAIEEEQERPLGPVATASPALASILHRMRAVGRSDRPLLLGGETGTGKEVYARAIHHISGRSGPFVPVNCAGLNRELFESQLFGYKRGSHSQAREDHPGILATAEGGTLFLDETGEMDPAMQAKLLRLLQDGTFLGLGSTRPRRTDVRIVAATQQPEQTLRLDILGRLGSEALLLPPLRRRREDLPALCRHLLGAGRVNGQPVPALHRRAALALCLHRWPKNVRELEATLLEAELVAAERGTPRIGVEDLPGPLRDGLAQLTAPARAGAPPVQGTKQPPRPRPIRAELERLLRAYQGSVPEVARRLGRHRELVWRWIKADGVDPAAFRGESPSLTDTTDRRCPPPSRRHQAGAIDAGPADQ